MKEAKLTHVTGSGKTEFEVVSLQHVRVESDGTVSIELPFFTAKDGAQSIYINMDKTSALLLTARLASTVAHGL